MSAGSGRVVVSTSGAHSILTVSSDYTGPAIQNSIDALANLDVIEQDDLGIWDAETEIGTMPTGSGGRWLVSFQAGVGVGSLAGPITISAWFKVNGSYKFQGAVVAPAGYAADFTISGPAKVIDLADGDVIRLVGLCNDATGATFKGGNKALYLNMLKID